MNEGNALVKDIKFSSFRFLPSSPHRATAGLRTEERGVSAPTGRAWRAVAGRGSSRRAEEEKEVDGCWWRPGCRGERRGASPCRAA